MGYAAGFWLGHNEDWSEAVKPFWYWVRQSVQGVPSCAGLAYPGTLIGYAPTWNEHGLFSTQNALVPHRNNQSGLGVNFVQRRAFCHARNLSEAISLLTIPGWSSGASLNLMDMGGEAMANVEVWEDEHAVYHVTTNFSHMNMYKSPALRGRLDSAQPSTMHRQDRLNVLPAPHVEQDVRSRLGDTHDEAFPIYRNITLTTVVADGLARQVMVWENSNPYLREPTTIWNLSTSFF